MTGQMTYGMAIPIIMGQNIGTCVTAVISSIGVSRSAKRVSVVHISFNVLGTVFWLIAFYAVNAFVHFGFVNEAINPVGIAFVHSIFNLATTLLLLPFTKLLEKIANKVIPDTEETGEKFLDERLMATPAIALEELENSMMEMADKTEEGLGRALALVSKFDPAEYKFVMDNEDRVDWLQDNIGGYVTKLSTTQHLSEEGKKQANSLLQSVNEFERLADYANNIANSANEMNEKKLFFSEEAAAELAKLFGAITECYKKAIVAFRYKDPDLAKKIPPLSSLIEDICEYEKEAHADRVNAGVCTPEQGYIFNDILASCTRIGGHCSNIAVSIIRLSENKTGHVYMHDLKSRYREQFSSEYTEYYKKYMPNREADPAE